MGWTASYAHVFAVCLLVSYRIYMSDMIVVQGINIVTRVAGAIAIIRSKRHTRSWVFGLELQLRVTSGSNSKRLHHNICGIWCGSSLKTLAKIAGICDAYP